MKDEQQQQLLQSAIEQSLSLTQIKQKIKELTVVSKPELPTMSDRLVLVSRQLKGLTDPKKQKRLEKLLQDLESLVET